MPLVLAQVSPFDDVLPPLARVGIVFALVLAWGIWMRRREARAVMAAGARASTNVHSAGVIDPPHRSTFRQIAMALLIQALIWSALTVAFAALLRLAGPQPWSNALRFAALNWMPWAVLGPAVFWFSGRFPLERGHLWTSIPAHVLGCIGCVAFTVWVATYVGYITRPTPGRFEERRVVERPPADQENSEPGLSVDHGTSRPERAYTPPALQRGLRPDRFRVDGRPPFARHGGGPFWWPFLGTTLLRANFDAAVYLIVIFAAHALAFYRRAQDRERHAVALAAGLHRAKLDALRLQLQPHFLFNTLNAISTLVHRDASAADELIGDLSDLLRVSLQTTDHQVPLARELELLDRYLAIEKTRLGERLRIVREIEPGTESALVPTFLLQPLVENAIRHGIEPRLAAGTITLRAQRDQGRLKLLVADDGVGVAASNGRGRRGIGITNTEERLHALHGEAATLVIATPVRGGTEVRIALPFVTELRHTPGERAPNPADPERRP